MSKTIIKEVKTGHGAFSVRDNEQDGLVVVLLHGWPETSYCWEAMLDYLPKNHRLIRPDLRGLGNSDRSLARPAYLKNEMAADIWRILDKLEVNQVVLVGHDWGGAIVQEMAISQPKRVQAMVLMNILLINNLKGNLKAREAHLQNDNLPNWYHLLYQQENLPERLIEGNEEVWLRYFLRMSKQRLFPEEAIEEYLRAFKIPDTPTTSAYYYRTLPKDKKRWATYEEHKFTMPSLYVYGKRDSVIIPSFLEHIDDCFEHITVKEFDAGHFVHEELPEEVAQALNDFLAEIEG
ncbi:alpha/beta fold hydrolase [Microscilla marina]|uniref:Hydrolase, alpha/beta fold family, putative n=1 Tax=Microscilla marina ATCC 23134 TaxID=313606 RepID=A1ZHQ0_MICM2|nr:alpha/beta hydrolase [Microscilla marina]EAY30057.1 hydrolase, alpha/beta fold family, putative [Microscilla marina ATCC 23134]